MHDKHSYHSYHSSQVIKIFPHRYHCFKTACPRISLHPLSRWYDFCLAASPAQIYILHWPAAMEMPCYRGSFWSKVLKIPGKTTICCLGKEEFSNFNTKWSGPNIDQGLCGVFRHHFWHQTCICSPKTNQFSNANYVSSNSVQRNSVQSNSAQFWHPKLAEIPTGPQDSVPQDCHQFKWGLPRPSTLLPGQLQIWEFTWPAPKV